MVISLAMGPSKIQVYATEDSGNEGGMPDSLTFSVEAKSSDSGDGGNGGGSTGGGSTGDGSNIFMWFVLAFVNGIGALYFGKKGFVLEKVN